MDEGKEAVSDANLTEDETRLGGRRGRESPLEVEGSTGAITVTADLDCIPDAAIPTSLKLPAELGTDDGDFVLALSSR